MEGGLKYTIEICLCYRRIYKMLEIESKKLKGTYRCQFYHDHEKLIAGLDEGKNSSLIYQKSVAIKKAINDMLFQKKTEDEALVELKEAFDKVGYATPETERRHLEESWRQILRYVHSETRHPECLIRKTVSPFQLMNISFKADYLFSGYKTYVRKTKVGRKVETYHTTEPYVEVVRMRPGKPDVSMGSKRKDKGVMTCLELYCMLMYAKEVAETMTFPRNEKIINVEASYYYLRRNGDKVEDIREDDFFDNKSKNILTLSDVYYTADPSRKTEIDANFKKEFLEFLQSQECDPENCEHCTLNAVCNFTKPPEYIEKELTQKSLDSISLTEAQEKVIGFRKGFARVNAGAGAGKTMCVALRTAFLLSEGVDPAKICLLTFTNTGAAEMKERIGLYCEDFGLNINLDTLTVTTFNSFGDKIIHKNYEELGFEKEPRLIDDIEQSKIVAEMLKDNVVADLDYRNFNMNMPFVKGALPTAKKAFEIIKRENLSNESDVDILWEKMKNESYDIVKTAAAALIELYGEYDDRLRERSLIEYADQELLIFELLKKNPFYFEDYGFEHIIVDEFQDTSQLQFEILKNIINSSLEFKSFLVVGDDSQSIFGFRGSNPQFIIEFEEKLGERVQDFYLLENHRSTKSIIDFANKINSLNKNRVVKDLIPTREKGESVIVEAFEKKNEEEDHIVSIIKEKIDEGHPLEDIAYIASTRSQLLKMGTRLTEEGIQWIMLNPEPMFSNSRIEGALSLARYLADNTATKDLFVYLNAVNNSEILEKKTDEEILSFIEKQKTALSSFYSDVDDTVKRNWLINYLEYLKGHKEVSDEVYEAFLKKVLVWDTYEEMLEYMLDFRVYGEREAAKRCKDYPGVVLTTAHSSKGMEWPIVIDEISKYHDKNLRDEKDIEEKRRLFFVSATRARDELYVVAQRYAYGSKGNGKSIPDTRVQNIFLREAVWAVEEK